VLLMRSLKSSVGVSSMEYYTGGFLPLAERTLRSVVTAHNQSPALVWAGLWFFMPTHPFPYLWSKFIVMEHLIQHISINSAIRFGKPCIVGTRIAVVDILQWLASGMTIAEIIEDYPTLTDAHVRAALAFAAHRESHTRLIAA
jgi:uncharacterized protein (DUF433 family)